MEMAYWAKGKKISREKEGPVEDVGGLGKTGWMLTLVDLGGGATRIRGGQLDARESKTKNIGHINCISWKKGPSDSLGSVGILSLRERRRKTQRVKTTRAAGIGVVYRVSSKGGNSQDRGTRNAKVFPEGEWGVTKWVNFCGAGRDAIRGKLSTRRRKKKEKKKKDRENKKLIKEKQQSHCPKIQRGDEVSGEHDHLGLVGRKEKAKKSKGSKVHWGEGKGR